MFIIASCNDRCPDRMEREVVVLYDVTEMQIAKPDADAIIRLSGLDTNMWDGAIFSFAYLTDVSYNRRTSFGLAPGGNRLTSSSFTREREVKKFEDSVRSFIGSLAYDTTGRPHSSIYLVLANELNRLAKQPHSRTLLVYSDLMENDLSLSFYDKKTFALLQSDPAKIESLLNAKTEFGDLTGITIHFIYEPENANDDETFRIVSGFYKSLLESHGATVLIGADISVDRFAGR